MARLTSLRVVDRFSLTFSARRGEGVWKSFIHPCRMARAFLRSAYASDSSGVHHSLDLSHSLHLGMELAAAFSMVSWSHSVALSSSSGVAICLSEFRVWLTSQVWVRFSSCSCALRASVNFPLSVCFQFRLYEVSLNTISSGSPMLKTIAWWSDRALMAVSI